MIKRSLIYIVVSSIFLISSCSPTIQSIDLKEFYESEFDLKTAKHDLPTYVVNGRKPKIAVSQVELGEEALKKCGIDKSAVEVFKDTLMKTGVVDVVDDTKGADYIITASIISARIGTNTKETRCTEYGNVKISTKLLELPSRNIVRKFDIDGVRTINRDIKYSFECKIQDPCGLLNEATLQGIDDLFEEFKNLFPAYGYVYKTASSYKEPNKRLAFTTIGTSHGIKPGDKVSIIEFSSYTDPIKRETVVMENEIAECVILEIGLSHNRSICLIPSDKANLVFVKHAVKTKVNLGFDRKLEKFNRYLQKFNIK